MKQPIFWRTIGFDGVGFIATGESFSPIRCGNTTFNWQAQPDATHPWSVAGSFTSLKVSLIQLVSTDTIQHPVGPGAPTLTYTILIDGVDTGLNVPITGSDTFGISTTTTPITPGQQITLRRRADSSVSTVCEWVEIIFESTNTGESGYGTPGSNLGAGTNRISGNGDYFNCPLLQGIWFLGDSTPAGGPTLRDQPYAYVVNAINGSLFRYDVVLNVAPGSGQSFLFAVALNGILQDGSGGTVDTRLTISDLATTGAAIFDLPITETDTLCLQVHSPTHAAASSGARIGCGIRATVDGQSQMPGDAGNANLGNPTHVGLSYPYVVEGFNYPRQWVEADCAAPIGLAATITNATIWTYQTPGTGQSWTMRLRDNLASPTGGPTATISDTAFRAFGAGTVDVAADDVLSLQFDTLNSPSSVHFAWNFAISIGGPPPPPPPTPLGCPGCPGAFDSGTNATGTGCEALFPTGGNECV